MSLQRRFVWLLSAPEHRALVGMLVGDYIEFMTVGEMPEEVLMMSGFT